jgi:HEAT repeat protein
MIIASLVFVKASVVVALAATAALVARRTSAATRAAIWWVALAMLLALPLGPLVLPAWTPVPAALRPAPAAALALVAQPAAPAGVAYDAAPDHTHALAQPQRAAFSPRALQAAARRATPWLFVLWGVGALGAGVSLLFGVRRSRSLRRSGLPAPARVQALALAGARRLGLSAVPPVVICPTLAVPAQGGIRTPTVLLPEDAAEWPDERLRVVLLHELAHIARRDLLLHVLGRIVVALYWPNPLVHVALRRAAVETERACDDTVLRAGTAGSDYAGHLAAVAALIGGTRTGTALAMARPSTLLVRVRAILDGRSDRRAVSRRFTLATALGAVCIALSVGASRPAGNETPALVTALASDAPAMRRAAAWRLGALARGGARTALEARLADPDPGVRGVAAWALGRLRARQAVPALIALARDPDPSVRELTALALGAIGDARATGTLATLADDPDWSVRAVTTQALWHLDTEEAAEILARRITLEPDEHARGMAVWALELIDKRATPDGLLRALQHPSAATRHEALSAISRRGADDQLDAVARALTGDTVESIRAHAAGVLCQIGGESVVPALVAAMRDPSWHVRASAICGLGKFGGPAASAALLVALRDNVHQVRLSAVEALNDGFER